MPKRSNRIRSRWIASLIYRALLWKERQRARRPSGAGQRRGQDGKPEFHDLGARGEMLVYWHLRQAGYVIIARNRRPGAALGELDLVGWDGPVLAFIEVKTRGSNVGGPPQNAVRGSQQKRIVRSAQQYVRRLQRKPPSYRFDVAGVLWDPVAGYKVQVIKNAYRL